RRGEPHVPVVLRPGAGRVLVDVPAAGPVLVAPLQWPQRRVTRAHGQPFHDDRRVHGVPAKADAVPSPRVGAGCSPRVAAWASTVRVAATEDTAASTGVENHGVPVTLVNDADIASVPAAGEVT